jgi:hypothetical protein
MNARQDADHLCLWSHGADHSGFGKKQEFRNLFKNVALAELVQQCVRRLEIGCVKAFGETAVDRLKYFSCSEGAAVIAPRSCETGRGAQFPGQSPLPASQIERLPKVILGRCRRPRCVLNQQELAFDARQFSHFPKFAGALGTPDRFVDRDKSVGCREPRTAAGQPDRSYR